MGFAGTFRDRCAIGAAIGLISSALSASPLTEADQLYNAGDLKGAETKYRQALASEPDNVFALEGLTAAIRFQPGRSSSEASPFQTQLDTLRGKPYPHSHSDELADAYFKSHDYKNAEPLYRESLAADANDFYARARLIDCLDGQGKAEESAAMQKQLQTAKAAAEPSPAIRAQLDSADRLLADHQYDPAAHAYAAVLESDPNNKAALVGLGSCAAFLGKKEEARVIEQKLAAMENPSRPAATPPPLKSVVAPAGMSGWIAVTQARGGNLDATIYNISGSNVYQGTPNGAKSFAELQQAEPARCGTVRTANGEMIFQFPDKPPQHVGGVIQKVTPMQAGATFAGKYAIANSGSFGGVDSYGADEWNFSADGSYQHQSTGYVYTTAHPAGTGDNPAQSNAASDHGQSGKYRFDNGVMTLSGDGSTHSVWNIGDKSPPWYLLIDGKVFTGQQ